MQLLFLKLTDDVGNLVAREWLSRVEAVHRQLHDFFPVGTAAYAAKLARICATGGRLYAAVEGENVRGVAVGRILEDSRDGRHLHLDDVVVDAACRGRGVGRAMLDWLETEAKAQGCGALTLDSRVARETAHRFYFQRSYGIASFHFLKQWDAKIR